MIEKNIPSFADIRAVNPHRFAEVDYANYVLNAAKSPVDLLRSFSEVYFPIFSIKNSMVFNVSFGCYDTFIDNISKGMNELDAHYWAHVIDVEGTFLVPRDFAIPLSEKMCIGWNLSLEELGRKDVKFSRSCDDEILIFPEYCREDTGAV